MTFPLDAVHATTLSNDILLSTVLWSGGLLFLLSCRHCQDKKYVYLSLVSGFITGAAVAVKFNALVAPVLFLSIGFVGLWKQLSKGAYKTLIAWSIGWITANGLLCIFLYALSGDFLAHYHAEMRFNLDYNPSGFTAGGESLIQFLLLYPRWISNTSERRTSWLYISSLWIFLSYLYYLPTTCTAESIQSNTAAGSLRIILSVSNGICATQIIAALCSYSQITPFSSHRSYPVCSSDWCGMCRFNHNAQLVYKIYFLDNIRHSD